jgi:hypothetical protein
VWIEFDWLRTVEIYFVNIVKKRFPYREGHFLSSRIISLLSRNLFRAIVWSLFFFGGGGGSVGGLFSYVFSAACVIEVPYRRMA